MQDDGKRPSFAGKLFLLLPRPTRQCPKDIGYHEVTAYGELLYRSRLDLKTTPSDMAAAVGCERWRTLPKVIKRLQEHGLADERLRALPDGKGFFHRKQDTKRKWQDQFQTTTVYRQVPGGELTDVRNGILWTVHSFNSAGQQPYPSSIAKLLRLDLRTVTKHLEWLQEHGYMDADWCVTADPCRWQDATPKLKGDPEARWEEFAAEWVGSRYDDNYCQGKPYFALSHSHFRRSFQEGCEAMAEAGYASDRIRAYWETEVPEACSSEKRAVQLWLMEYVVHRLFYRMFDAVERVTSRNRQLGKFHGADSLGLLRQVTAAQVRTMKARVLEGGMEGLETWAPDLSSLGSVTSPRRRAGARAGRRSQEDVRS